MVNHMGNYQAMQWCAVDITVHTDREYRNPFEDVDVFGVFQGPDGKSIKLLAFWDGDGNWVLRFAPTAVGTWSYMVESTDRTNEDFAGEGEVECVPYAGELDMYKHGFLRVSDDKTYLEHADKTPFFWLGDTHWTFVTEERFDESNCPKYASEFKACVDKRIEQRFTVYQCNFRDGKVSGYFGKNLDMMHENEDGSFTPNLELFHTNVDPKMKYLADVGLYTAVGYAWGYDMETNGLARYKAFAKYTMARYGAYPVCWTLAGELPGYSGDLDENVRLWGEVAKECDRWNVYDNLQSVHLACSRPFPKIYEKEPWFDFAMSQAGHGDADMDQTMYEEFRQMYEGHPIVESEGLYEMANSGELSSRPITPAMMRRLAYLIMQSGGCGYTYGVLGVWEWQKEAGVGGIGWGDLAWYDGLELPGADQLTIFRDFYEEMDWSTLKPLSDEQAETKSFFMSGVPNRAKIFFTGNADMTTVVGYMTETSMREFVLRGLGAPKYEVFFMDPENGERTFIEGGITPENGEWHYKPKQFFGTKKDQLVVVRAQQ